jgi:hypothetical protein
VRGPTRFLGHFSRRIFYLRLLRPLKSRSFRADFHPGTGINAYRNWDGLAFASEPQFGGARLPHGLKAFFGNDRPNDRYVFSRAALAEPELRCRPGFRVSHQN